MTALVIEDRRGHRAVFADADFPMTLALSDVIAAQLVKTQDLDRAGLILRGTGSAMPNPDKVLRVVAAAIRNLEPAAVSSDGKSISVRTTAGACIGAIPAGSCTSGVPVTAAIRAVFRMVEPDGGLQKRGELRRAYPIQAIAFGKDVTILALGGDAQYPAARGVIVLPSANDVAIAPQTPAITSAIRRLLRQ